MLQEATKTRHYRIHLSASHCTLLSIVGNIVLILFLFHSWSAPCNHLESEHLVSQPDPADFVSTITPSHNHGPYIKDDNRPLISTPSIEASHTFKTRSLSEEESSEANNAAELTLPTTSPNIATDILPRIASHQRNIQEEGSAVSSLLQPTTSMSDGVLRKLWHPPPASDALDIKNDLSLNTTFNVKEHDHTWIYCTIGGPNDPIIPQTIEFCSQTPNVEQKYQMSWFGTHVVPGLKRPFPKYLNCVHLPPHHYQWPNKYPPLPSPIDDAVYWPNFRVSSHKELIVFNEATPKNLYHFEAKTYDQDALGELSWAAKYIPFGPKIRNMLDVGAGGGSLGLLLHRKYDVQVLSTVFADWPYCEYITERGGLCMLVDVMEPMPFAKYTFDVLHISWVYHGQQPDELLIMFNELNRVIRPGGYIWMRGGWSMRQITTMQSLLIDKMGYSVLIQEVKNKPMEITRQVSFGDNLPYEADWNIILVKPIKAILANDCNINKVITG